MLLVEAFARGQKGLEPKGELNHFSVRAGRDGALIMRHLMYRHLMYRFAFPSVAMTCLAVILAASAASAQNSTSGAVEQSIGPPITQNPSLPPVQLSDAQRARIQRALSSQHTEVSFALKSAKPSEKFQPSVGAPIPRGLHPLALPRPLIYEMPVLKRYTYLKFKHEVLIVNPMTRRIVDIFPEANG